MFRRPSGGLGFSFNRMVQNAVPNFASDNPERDADVSLAQQDLLFQYQLTREHPMMLEDESFRIVGVIGGYSLLSATP